MSTIKSGHHIDNLLRAAWEDPQQLLAQLNSSADSLSSLQAQLRLARLGPNQIARQQPVSWFRQLLATFRNPLVALLAAMAALSLLSGDLGLQLEGAAAGPQEIPIERLVPGDLVRLAAGDMIPADVRLLQSRHYGYN